MAKGAAAAIQSNVRRSGGGKGNRKLRSKRIVTQNAQHRLGGWAGASFDNQPVQQGGGENGGSQE